MKYQLVIFDFDGTLADSFSLFLRTFNAVAGQYGTRPILDTELNTLRTMGARGLIRHFGIAPWKVPFIAYSVRRRMAQSITEVRLFEGIPELLTQLNQAGVRLAIVSSNSEANIRRVLGPACSATITDYVCGTAIFGKAKAFSKVLRLSGVSPAQTLCVGDELRDWEASLAVGIPFAAVGWGYTYFDALPTLPEGQVINQVEAITNVVLASE
ncbi:HAD hydrolase-like protein [Rudanella paleaurantiibacter]|uniref:HAD hydrolase-like protein n=1 Tax=Rudanella paleaurantiibacter TaxID=2614655 RepID=A0A7J5TVW9_9BACT|nr:HAD hydrolase-like protein [Rudanella paleaurantiibacter]KAB7728083.1 HAD hydrolase-like protein [Rudanella paleaurantiibacter]